MHTEDENWSFNLNLNISTQTHYQLQFYAPKLTGPVIKQDEKTGGGGTTILKGQMKYKN